MFSVPFLRFVFIGRLVESMGSSNSPRVLALLFYILYIFHILYILYNAIVLMISIIFQIFIFQFFSRIILDVPIASHFTEMNDDIHQLINYLNDLIWSPVDGI